MLGIDVKLEDRTKRVTNAAEKAVFGNLQRAAFAIYQDSRASILKGPPAQKRLKDKATGQFTQRAKHEPSKPGTPPHTQRGQLKRAIVYDANRRTQDAVIGPRASVVGLAGHAHEFGDEFHGDEYPERPFMGPALDRQASEFGDSFQGSIGE